MDCLCFASRIPGKERGMVEVDRVRNNSEGWQGGGSRCGTSSGNFYLNLSAYPPSSGPRNSPDNPRGRRPIIVDAMDINV